MSCSTTAGCNGSLMPVAQGAWRGAGLGGLHGRLPLWCRAIPRTCGTTAACSVWTCAWVHRRNPFSRPARTGACRLDWRAMEHPGFRWMRKRAARAAEMFGLFRVDHVIGMYRTYLPVSRRPQGGISPSDEDAQIRLERRLLAIIGGFGQVVPRPGRAAEFLRLRWRPGAARLRASLGRRPMCGATAGKRPCCTIRWPGPQSGGHSGTHDTETKPSGGRISPDERRLSTSLPDLHGITRTGFEDQVRDALLACFTASSSECACCLSRIAWRPAARECPVRQ